MRKGYYILIFQTLQSTFDFNRRLEYPAVATFGFKKRMLHPAQTVDVAMPEFRFADQGTFMCSSCTKRFKNKQGRSIYIKCLHCGGTVENNN